MINDRDPAFARWQKMQVGFFTFKLYSDKMKMMQVVEWMCWCMGANGND